MQFSFYHVSNAHGHDDIHGDAHGHDDAHGDAQGCDDAHGRDEAKGHGEFHANDEAHVLLENILGSLVDYRDHSTLDMVVVGMCQGWKDKDHVDSWGSCCCQSDTPSFLMLNT